MDVLILHIFGKGWNVGLFCRAFQGNTPEIEHAHPEIANISISYLFQTTKFSVSITDISAKYPYLLGLGFDKHLVIPKKHGNHYVGPQVSQRDHLHEVSSPLTNRDNLKHIFF